MKVTRNWTARSPIHCCLIDRSCWQGHREFHMPMRLYLHFLKDRHGHGVFITLWGNRSWRKWHDSLEWVQVTGPPNNPD